MAALSLSVLREKFVRGAVFADGTYHIPGPLEGHSPFEMDEQFLACRDIEFRFHGAGETVEPGIGAPDPSDGRDVWKIIESLPEAEDT